MFLKYLNAKHNYSENTFIIYASLIFKAVKWKTVISVSNLFSFMRMEYFYCSNWFLKIVLQHNNVHFCEPYICFRMGEPGMRVIRSEGMSCNWTDIWQIDQEEGQLVSCKRSLLWYWTHYRGPDFKSHFMCIFNVCNRVLCVANSACFDCIFW